MVDDVCTDKTQFKFTYFSDALKPYCLFYTDFEEINNGGLCGKCSGGKYSYKRYCVAEGSYFIQTDASVAFISSLSLPNCLKYDSTIQNLKQQIIIILPQLVNVVRSKNEKGKNESDWEIDILITNCINFDSSNLCREC